MIEEDFKNLRMLNKDVLITADDTQRLSDIIDVVADDNRKEKINYFRVVRVSPNCLEVKEGDLIMLEFNEHMEPFRFENKSYAVTDEDSIIAIVD